MNLMNDQPSGTRFSCFLPKRKPPLAGGKRSPRPTGVENGRQTVKKKTLISVKSRISSKQNGERRGLEQEGKRTLLGRELANYRTELNRTKPKKQSSASRTVETQNAKVKENW